MGTKPVPEQQDLPSHQRWPFDPLQPGDQEPVRLPEHPANPAAPPSPPSKERS